MRKFAVVALPAVFAAVVTVASVSAIAQQRTYADPYPYTRSADKAGQGPYQLYPLYGCTDYEITAGTQTVKQICDRRAPGQIFKTLDKEGHGIAR